MIKVIPALDWEDAKKKSHGYQSRDILDHDLRAALNLLNSPIDVFIPPLTQYFITILSKIIHSRPEFFKAPVLRVIDFGGSWGANFKLATNFFPNVHFDWTIVEQEYNFKILNSFSKLNLRWTNKIDFGTHYDVGLFSASLQYLEQPYEVLSQVLNVSNHLILGRMPVYEVPEDLYFSQTVPKEIYEGSYPIRVFSWEKLKSHLTHDCKIVHYWTDNFDQMTLNGGILNFSGFYVVKNCI